MNTDSRTGWIVAGVLAVVVVILLGVMWKWNYDREHDVGYVLDRGGSKIMEIRAEIAEKCQGEAPFEQADCQDSLEELSDILREFTDDLEDINNASTTTDGSADVNAGTPN